MQIVDHRQNVKTVTIGEMKKGDCFEHAQRIYMVIESCSEFRKAIDLSTGEEFTFEETGKYTVAICKLIVEY